MRVLLNYTRALLDKWWLGWAAAVVLVVGALAWLWWWPREPEPRARQYRDETACLLTDAKGVAEAEAAQVWAGMQQASLATLVKVQYLAIAGPQTVENGETFAAGLAQGGCEIVLAVGEVPVQALQRSVVRFPRQRFVLVGVSSASAGSVSRVDASAVAIRDLIMTELGPAE